MTDTTNLIAEAEHRAAWHENEARTWRRGGESTPLAREHDATARTLRALTAALAKAKRETVGARNYLIRNVIASLHGDTVAPFDELLGVCTQVANITYGLRMERDDARAEIATAVEAERERIACEHDCGCAARIDVQQALDSGMRGKDAAARFCPAPPNCLAVEAHEMRARGTTDALAAALRQARTEGMREAATLVATHVYSNGGSDGAYLRPSADAAIDKHHQTIAAAILAAADAKENQK